MTDRIEAIRARHADRMAIRGEVIIGGPAEDDDMAVLLAEVDSLRVSLEYQDGQTASLHGVIAELRAAPDAEPGGAS